ncbi:MAG: hypothetical protein IPP18_17995 [Rhodocyclaceae bacterium]|jgi:hypothetical protein|nr:hypothetical protein [Rhodocyclaceae bacterium]MBK6553238.1 hypothetical protein [Rhodocyclaceae bacterium]MBK9311745.1 hypothetical protein [Rhodocyclaceae bacterium]MBK9956899.1 hypothetical protein [Rhodocyclaceae bacterium]
MHPKAGTTYASRIDPTIRLFVETVDIVEPFDDHDGGVYISACHADEKDDMGAIGLDLDGEQWNELVRLHDLTAEA